MDIAQKKQVEYMMNQVFANLDKFVPAYAAVASRQRPTEDQEKAITIFKQLGTGLAARDFTTIAAYLPPRGDDGKLKVAVPERAAKARVYSTNGVTPYDVRPGDVLVIDNPADWVARIEFFDAKGVVIDATGSEQPPGRRSSPPRAY